MFYCQIMSLDRGSPDPGRYIKFWYCDYKCKALERDFTSLAVLWKDSNVVVVVWQNKEVRQNI